MPVTLRLCRQEEQDEAAAAVSQVLPLAEAGEGVIILREEEDGSLTYVPGLQETDTDGRVVQVSGGGERLIGSGRLVQVYIGIIHIV